jgi:signal transduction histidine kinase
MIHNGKGAVLSGNASPLFDRTGKVVGAIESMRDITEVKRLEAQLRQAQKMESVGTLAGGIAHDFNNILTTLIGYATITQMKMGKNNPLRSHVDQILSASQKAADLTRSLLTFSREQPVSLIPLDINNTIKAAKKLLKRLLTEDIELRTSLTKDDTVVMADKSQMDQILFNLVTNARDAMPKGGMLTIQTGITAMDKEFTRIHGFGEPGRYVLISVSDTGTGMDEATRDKIFDPFFTTKETGKGTGLGLTTVYGIIKQHNGHITVYSEPKQGTTFRIYLPAADTRAGRETNTEPFVSTGNETILIAEDNEGVRHVMREALQEYGYKTIEAIDGEDAINKFKQHQDIDLIIIDSVMPKKNGCEVYGEIRKINSHIKVLFTSGHTKDIVLNKGIEDGEFDFIAKPLLFNEFLQKVREVLDR